MHGQANMIESPLGNGRNVFFRDVFGPVYLEETIRGLLADQACYLRPDGTRRATVGGKNVDHIPLRHEPAAQTESAYDHRIALPVEDLRTLGPEKALPLRRKDQEKSSDSSCDAPDA